MQLSSNAHIPDGLLAEIALLSEKPHQGVPSWNLAPHQGIDERNSTAAIGLRASEHLNRIWSRFTGKERDTESGNDYFGARYYASTMGRFLSPDWSAKEEPVPYAQLDDPQSLNLYSYVRNNPLSRTDPTGHEDDGCCLLDDIDTVVKPLVDSAEGALATGAENTLGAAVGVFGVFLLNPTPAGSAAERDWELHHNDPAWQAAHGWKPQTPTPTADHTKDARPSTKDKHEAGQSRKNKDRGGEKGDARRRPPRKRPDGWKGPWPPPPPPPPPPTPPAPPPAPDPEPGPKKGAQ